MSALLDERPYVVAVRAAINEASTEFDAYDYDDIPGGPQNATEAGRNASLPKMFALVSLERRANTQLRLTANTTRTGWRLAIRAAGRTTDECRGVGFKTAVALHEEQLLIDGRLTTPIQFESQRAAEWDDGRYVSDYIWTFAH